MQFQQTMNLKEYNWTIGMSFMTWMKNDKNWRCILKIFKFLTSIPKSQMALGIPSPSFTTFMLLHQKLPTIITKLAYFATFPKGGRAPLCFYWWVPNVSKKKVVPSKEKERKKKKLFLEFGVPKCIPYDSFMFPPSAQWFCMFPMFPIGAHFILYVLAKFLFL